MKSEIQPTLFAVGALIVCGDEFAAVTETNTSRKSVKLAGQRTYPMETVEDFDGNDLATITRACKEEVKLDINGVEAVPLNVIETRPGVELRNYVMKVSSKTLVERGAFIQEVSPVLWLPLSEVIISRGSLQFRPGVYETVRDYLRRISNPTQFEPAQYRHTQLADQIPEEVYGLVEAGLTRTEAVSQWLRSVQP